MGLRPPGPRQQNSESVRRRELGVRGMKDNSHQRPRRIWVVAGATGVLVWRAAAHRWPSSLVSIPDGLQLPLALLGAVFLVSGIGAWWARPGRWTAMFLLYGLCGGVHWGGAIGGPVAVLETSLFFVYLAITALGDAALLHLASTYPHGAPLARKWRVVLYAPAAVGLSLAVMAVVAPRTMLEPAAGVLLLIGNLFSLVAGATFIVRLFSVDRTLRRTARLPLIVTGMVTGSLVALLGAGGVLPGEPEAWNLALGIIPMTLGIALVSQSVEPSIGVEAT